MINWIIQKIVGTKNQREVRRMSPVVAEINRIEASLQALSDNELRAKTAELKARVQQGETLDAILPEAFAVVKNCCRRFTDSRRMVSVRGQDLLWEMIPFDVQLVGGMVLHSGRIAEMATGEGKTLVATLPTYLNALTGKGVHIVTVNDYLAARDAEWVGEVHRFLGLTVGCLQHGQTPAERRVQYACDITYGTNSEFGFDYLRDNGMASTVEELVQRGHYFAIIDEVDSILIDEARTPLIISGPVTVSTHQFDKYKASIDALVRKQNQMCTQWAQQASKLLEEGNAEQAGRLFFKVKLGMPRNKQLLRAQEDPGIRRLIDDAELSLYQDARRTELYKVKEELYFTIEEKSHEADLSDMGRHFLNPQDPDMFVLPDLITINHDIDNDPAIEPDEKQRRKQAAQQKYDETAQRAHNISQLLRAYCVYEKDVNYVVQENKVIIVDEYTGRMMPGRRWSDGLHQAVEAKEGVQIDRETQTLATITIQNYFRLYDKLAGMTGTAETEAAEFRDIYKLDVVNVPTHRPCIRKDTNDTIFKTRRAKLNHLIEDIRQRHAKGQPILVGTASVESSEVISRMLKRENITHNVLNAKYHQQEAEIVSRAGQKHAITIATNMAGRGTDIKLGPGVAELGGLHVVGTERHESRRIDRQLRGRCARQGDPGSSQFFISFEDELMRNFGDPRRISSLMTRLGMEDEEGIEHPWLNKSVETAQKRVEQRNYMIRKHTLQYDDVMNQQRQVIYTNRTTILETQDTRTEVFNVIDECIEEEVVNHMEGGEEPDYEGLLRWVNSAMPLAMKPQDIQSLKDSGSVINEIQKRVRTAYDLKIQFENPSAIQSMERFILLNAIDRLWQEHLYAMDGLRQSIGLRQYAQRDPLVEYKQEAFQMFVELMQRIKREAVHNLFRSATSLAAFEQFLRQLPQTDGRGPMLDPGAQSAPRQSAPAAKEDDAHIKLPIHRELPKIGRNDMVTIRKGAQSQTMKFKKAEKLLREEGWSLVER